MSIRMLARVGLGLWLLLACEGAPAGGEDGGSTAEAGPPPPWDAALPDARAPDGGSPGDARVPPRDDAGAVDPPPDWPESRGWSYVRANPMYISALVVRMDDPPRSAVDRYFDDFGATGIHLWETSMGYDLDAWLAHRPGAAWLSWLHGDGTNVRNGEVLGGYGAPPAGRIGYQIGDEPRTWEAMNEILGGLEAVRDADPAGLRVVNFSIWAEGIDAFVDRYCESGLGDVISYDLYSRGNGHYETLRYFRDAGLRCGMPYWRYVKGYIGGGEDLQTRSDMRWAAFVGLTYGYTGHSWFLYQVRGGDAEGIPTTFFTRTDDWSSPTTERFAWGAEINREMAVYGRALTQLLSTEVAWATDVPVSGVHPPRGATLFRAGMDPHLRAVELDGRFVDALLGFFVDRHGDRYVIVQNPSHSNGSFPTDDDERLRATLRFDFSGAPGVDPSRIEVLEGSGRVTPRTLSGGALDIDLEAGDILFFKYATGRPFAGY